MQIDCDFPGGNILVERIEDSQATLRCDLRDTEGDWFYFGFRVRGAGGQTITFRFADSLPPLSARGPAVSQDEGDTWRWLGDARAKPGVFEYHFADDAPVRFCTGMAYTQAQWQAFLAGLGHEYRWRQDTLCRSVKGRDVECLKLGRRDQPPRHRLLITARQHACEMMASYQLEGLIKTLVGACGGDPASDAGRWCQENVQVLVVPFMDKDGVEAGDQGKNRRPRDHNRDYAGTSLYAETAAVRRLVESWHDGVPLSVVDLHCPWIRGQYNEWIYQPGSAVTKMWQRQQALAAILERSVSGPLPYLASDDLPYGCAWNADHGYRNGLSLGRWAATLPHIRLATTFEIPYADARGQEVNAQTARVFGGDLARALMAYLQT